MYRIKCDVTLNEYRVAKEKAIGEADLLSNTEEKLKRPSIIN